VLTMFGVHVAVLPMRIPRSVRMVEKPPPGETTIMATQCGGGPGRSIQRPGGGERVAEATVGAPGVDERLDRLLRLRDDRTDAHQTDPDCRPLTALPGG
jgi:hypothetical protein